MRNVVFDVGNVLIEWDPLHLYRGLIPDEAERTRTIEVAVAAARGRIPVCVGTTHAATERCIAYTQEAERLGNMLADADAEIARLTSRCGELSARLSRVERVVEAAREYRNAYNECCNPIAEFTSGDDADRIAHQRLGAERRTLHALLAALAELGREGEA